MFSFLGCLQFKRRLERASQNSKSPLHVADLVGNKVYSRLDPRIREDTQSTVVIMKKKGSGENKGNKPDNFMA